jgi:lipoate---protein ligase
MWRMIITDFSIDGPMHMSIDESLMIKVGEKKSMPVLRWYSWNKPSVSIGYFQSLLDEVNYEQCAKDGVEIFRRMTGGGAVYKYPKGELNYSVIIPISEEFNDILLSYKKICQPIISYFQSIGINAEFSGINDLIVDGKKISGNAQTRMHNAILQHGTILLDFDVNAMLKYLRISNEKISDKQISAINERVTCIRKIKDITDDELINGIKIQFEEYFKVKLIMSQITPSELFMADKIRIEKYSKKEWLWMR